ncbi:uncharacterized protein PRCAT00001185001 [Priceomyces carsonii]|uniref:uncharacterized protein n=1 Tax=Priceomyces carsonii TaxID=28549 RepID=UPI002EDB5EF0|nr:unnamed protein product [Priceomyces carsonii]
MLLLSQHCLKRSVKVTMNQAKYLKATFDVNDYNTINEGKARILTPKEDKVFYNPIQQFNRDLSITCIRAWSELFQKPDRGLDDNKKRRVEPFITILEALSATGLRAIRYGHEIPLVKNVVANDLLADAVKSIDRNIIYNDLDLKVTSNEGDAIKFMSQSNEKFNVIDLDPYGTAAPFIDSAIQAIKDNGILLVTCTDAGVLAGSGYPEKCFALYGGNNFGNTFMGGEANHEVGLRLILNMIASTAAKYKKTIEPLLSLSIDFYFRLIIRVKTSPLEVKKLASKTMISYHCIGCGQKLIQPLGRINGKKFQTPKLVSNISGQCGFCESNFNIGGPMWLGNLHDKDFINDVLRINETNDVVTYGTKERIKGMLTVAKNELQEPFYFNLNQLSSFFKAPPIPINDFVRALGNLNYEVSLTHAKKNCIKTNAPWIDIFQINKQWLINNNQKTLESLKNRDDRYDDQKVETKIKQLEKDIDLSPNLTPNMIGYKILMKLREIKDPITVNFTNDNEASKNVESLRKLKIVRYQENPTKNWGPKSRPSES